MNIVRHLALALAFTFAVASAARADDSVFTMELPYDGTEVLPAWMHGPPVSAPGGVPRTGFLLSPPAGRDLLLHLVFDEAENSGLRVEWQRDGETSSEVVAENLGESLGVANKRPLLLSAARLGGTGMLILQSTGLKQNVKRVRFEWVAERTMLAAATRYVPVVVSASRLALAEVDVDVKKRPPLVDEWTDRVIRAVMADGPEPVAPSVQVSVPLEKTPKLARVEASVAGAYLDQEVWVVVNNQEVGPLSIEVPTLYDPGYLVEPLRPQIFAGWRRGAVYVPAEVLLPGENMILFELRSPANSEYRNRVFVREAVLELLYPGQRKVNFSLPVADLPAEDPLPVDENLPPLSPAAPLVNEPAPAGALQEFWGTNGGSL